MKPAVIFALIAFPFYACTVAGAATASADIRGTAQGSKITGTVTLEDVPEGLHIRALIENATPGAHGFHIHEKGACGDGGKAAGDHYNPAGVEHGNLMKDGFAHAHAGDFGNIEIMEDGKGGLDTTIPGLCVAGCDRAVDGRSFVFHEKADDFGQPAGNAGARVACGEIHATTEKS